ncbi:MAG: TRAM domain-containing protein [Acidobacteria bacterium]|nr:MAG: TRAM domain-containing protein [Acidobacteriota bacterium]REK02240.1 MAG: TRAM domain-containing protein [Acidobacteriota bacterium]REK13957.1 MAG: TRAM domain-containing protein [Acidobacteriota bacterium]REK41952.1 MAG: TRAM domain-containing protein [Acidobacteriota bacterium]
MQRDLLLIRVVFIILLAAIAAVINPLSNVGFLADAGLDPVGLRVASAVFGALIGGLIVFFETRAREASLKTLIGGSVGLAIGVIGAFLVGMLISSQETATVPGEVKTFLTISLAFLLGYIGLMVGAAKGEFIELSALGGVFGEAEEYRDYKILDTSVIIDGRIADVAETGFLTGTIVIPQFILAELQQVADSPDSSKRQRGRRGLDMLQKLRNNNALDIQIVENDYPKVKEVDLKLIELGQELGGVVVTNDFNLNKVSELRGVSVLNINELANALKPVVLPGEAMRVFILKEGKEYNQGVAYLDDGTMVVVDNARKLIGKTADIAVTSVLQTTAGKMIFGRLWDENQELPDADNIHDTRSENMRKQAGNVRTETVAEKS